MKKLTIYFFSIMVFLSTVPVSASAQLFSDFSRTHWAYHDVKFLTEKEVIKGFNGRFFPNETLTRLDAAVMLGRAIGLTAPEEPSIIPTDMYQSTRGYQEVLAAINNGMFTVTDNLFLPTEPLTRKEMAKAIAVGYQYTGSNESIFSDLPIHDPYYSYVDAIAANDITKGFSDGTFRPEEPVNRLQFSVFLSRIYNQPLEYIVKQDGITLHKVRNAEEAINLALTYPKATVHPVSNSLVKYSEQTGMLSETGIRNGVLIYNGAEQNTAFSPEYFKPYITPATSVNKEDTLFDTFIVLGRSYPEGEFGVHTKNNANYTDWMWYLNQTFSEKGVLSNLNEAAKNEQKTVKVYISIPYPKIEKEIINFEGMALENNFESRYDLVNWYIDMVESVWNLSDYTHLDFKGFYWFSETMGYNQDDILVEEVSNLIHSKNKKFIYSPHALSTNFNRWKNYGFDGAYLQPNTFRLKLTDTQARLHKAFLQAQIYDSGINIEIDQYAPHQIDAGLENFKQYIEMAHRYGLPGRSLIFYQGIGMVDRMVKYNQASYKEAYRLLNTMALTQNGERVVE
jgi:hypothetical protein